MQLPSLISLLEAVAADNSGQVICYPSKTAAPLVLTYRDLLYAARKASWALRQQPETFEPGRVVLVHFESHWENIVWFWAVLLAGCIPAMSTTLSNNDTMRLSHLKHLSTTLKNPACLTATAHLPEFRGQDSIVPVAVESLPEAGLDSDLLDTHRAMPDDIAILMLTSGSTGHSKAAILTHRHILTALAGKYAVVPLGADTSFLNWVRCDHVAALVEIHLQALFARKDQVHLLPADVLSDPIFFLDIIDRHRVSRTFAPNFFLARIRAALQEGQHDWDLSCLRYMASGGETNVTKTGAAVAQELVRYGAPETVIVPGFGMTETCAGVIFNRDFPRYELENEFETASLGRCMTGISMRITSYNTPVTPGTIGHLELSGPALFKGYFNNPIANEESFTEDGWFKTGDMALIDGKGHLRLMGRAKDALIVNGVKHNPQEIETALEEPDLIPGLTPSFTCCFSTLHHGKETEEICVVYLPSYAEDDSAARATTADAIARQVLMATGAKPRTLPLDRTMLQKSALGKLSRGKIKAAYQRGEYFAYEEVNEHAIRQHRSSVRIEAENEDERILLDLFVKTLDIPEGEFDVQTSLFDMGITSVDLIRIKRVIEEEFNLPQELPIITLMTKPTVREVAAALAQTFSPETHTYNPVVPLQPRGNKTPLWLIHPGVGEILVFMNLAKFLTDRKVYALRARGFNEGETPFTSITECVETYVKHIKETQPHGPYALAGYSYGTMLAFEIAKVLGENGDEVRFLGSFNLPPHIKLRMRAISANESIIHLAYFVDLFSEEMAEQLATILRAAKASREQVLNTVLALADRDRLVELGITPNSLSDWATLAYELHAMATEYDPVGSVPSIDVFYCEPLSWAADSKNQWRDEHLSRWAEFSATKPVFHEVQGAHYTMLRPEYVFGFQGELRRALEARGV